MHGRVDAVVQTGSVRDVRIGDDHDRRGVFALLVVVVLLVVAGVVAVWRVTADEEPPASPLAATTDVRLKKSCQSGWVVPDPGDVPIPISTRKRPAGAVLGSGGEVAVTVQGLTGAAVVLQSARVEVVRRAPAMTGAFLPSPCGAEVEPRYFRLDLDPVAPEVVPWDDEGGPVPPFPYKVNDFEPELLVIRPYSGTEDVEWRLHLRWTSGGQEGELLVDDGGTPFRTTAVVAARPFCADTEAFVWRPSC
ncbi:hypothetical protein ACWEFJ_14840 [Actinosynnema sp. NPDC004786]